MSYKSYTDLERVISLGKPDKVIDLFLESYLQGEELKAWTKTKQDEHSSLYPDFITNPDFGVVDDVPPTIPNPDYIEFETWLNETVEVEIVPESVDVEGNIIPAVFETQKVREFAPIDVSTKQSQWKTDNYQLLRKSNYPDIYEYIDAVVKDDAAAIQAYKDKCLAVKTKFPKGV